MSKIPKGYKRPIPTRTKKPHLNEESGIVEKISVYHKRIGMMELIDHVGVTSGIDDGIYSNTDIGTAQKIISIAKYLLATDENSLPGITTWQYNHPIPYEGWYIGECVS
jgi:hypothetical protein